MADTYKFSPYVQMQQNEMENKPVPPPAAPEQLKKNSRFDSAVSQFGGITATERAALDDVRKLKPNVTPAEIQEYLNYVRSPEGKDVLAPFQPK